MKHAIIVVFVLAMWNFGEKIGVDETCYYYCFCSNIVEFFTQICFSVNVDFHTSCTFPICDN